MTRKVHCQKWCYFGYRDDESRQRLTGNNSFSTPTQRVAGTAGPSSGRSVIRQAVKDQSAEVREARKQASCTMITNCNSLLLMCNRANKLTEYGGSDLCFPSLIPVSVQYTMTYAGQLNFSYSHKVTKLKPNKTMQNNQSKLKKKNFIIFFGR